MPARLLTLALLVLGALAMPRPTDAVVVVRRARPIAVVATVAVVSAAAQPPPPTTVVVTTPPPPPAATEKLPVNTTMWTLPSGCLKVSVSGQELHQCGPNYLKPIHTEQGTYYAVVPTPQ